MAQERKINVAVIGVGSFTKALVEGVSFYTKHPEETRGLMHPKIGGYAVSDIDFVAAFDVDERKVGKKLHEAIRMPPNVTKKITQPLAYKALVHRGPTHDSVHDALRGKFVKESRKEVADVSAILRETKAEVVLNLIPSGGMKASYAYATAALQAGVGFINCIPTPLATLPLWQKRFARKGLVLLGDDIKSQLGATMLNRILLEFLKMRGIRVLRSLQENRGGNADHFNLLYRADTKEKSKRGALTQFLKRDDATPKVTFHYTGKPSGHKRVTIEIDGELFGRTPIQLTSVIEDEISINGAGVAVDAIRAAKVLQDEKRTKDIWKIAPFLMKSPQRPMSDSRAFDYFNKVFG